MSATTVQNDWIARVLGFTPPPGKGKHADALDVAYAELLRVERQVLKSTRAAKPAELQGRFGYVASALAATRSQVERFADDDVRGAATSKPLTTAKVNEVSGLIAASKTRLIEMSLQQLTRVAQERAAATAILRTRADELTADPEARTELYKAASETLTDTGRDLGDWRTQIDEAKVWLAGAAAKFRVQTGILETTAAALEEIVEACLPPLTSRLPVPGEVPAATAPGGQQVPRIGAATPPTDAEVLQALKDCGNTWTGAKAIYAGDKTQMQLLADYRKKRVDQWLTAELGKYGLAVGPGKGWVSVGSTDPTSDYDISINKHGTVDGTPGGEPIYDFEMVKEFNDWFRAEFGGEGGTVFDTNLYAGAPGLVKNPDPDAVATGDVAALMKMRRYMSGGEFETLRHETIAACGEDVAQQIKVQRQFEEADINYRVALSDIIGNGIEKLEARIGQRAGQDMSEEQTRLDAQEKTLLEHALALQERGKRASGIEIADLQEDSEGLAREIDHALKDATLETTNEVYTKKKGEVIRQERVILALQGVQKALDVKPLDPDLVSDALGEAGSVLRDLKIDSGSIAPAQAALAKGDAAAFEQSLGTLTTALSAELGERLQQLGRSKALTMFFANEAYQSDGPFAHVVTATQAAEAEGTATVVADTTGILTEADKTLPPKAQAVIVELGGRAAYDEMEAEARKLRETAAQGRIDASVGALKTSRRAEIPKDQCLQSFNEQLGDFLKDLEHYGDEDPGKAIIQSSKYLERLLDAVDLMIGKDMFGADQGLLEELRDECKVQKDVKGQLIAARKGNLLLMPNEADAPVDQNEQRRAFACRFMKDRLGVTSLAGLAQRYKTLAVRINKAARVNLAAG